MQKHIPMHTTDTFGDTQAHSRAQEAQGHDERWPHARRFKCQQVIRQGACFQRRWSCQVHHVAASSPGALQPLVRGEGLHLAAAAAATVTATACAIITPTGRLR
jgi:hypothetical protein